MSEEVKKAIQERYAKVCARLRQIGDETLDMDVLSERDQLIGQKTAFEFVFKLGGDAVSLSCSICKHEWDQELLPHPMPVDDFVARIRKLKCPNCGAGLDDILLVAKQGQEPFKKESE